MSKGQTHSENSPAPIRYEICVKGHLDEQWSDWLDGLSIDRREGDNTVLIGEVVDQSALYGLLRRIRDLGMTLVSIVQKEPDLTEKDFPRKLSVKRFYFTHITKENMMKNLQKMGGLAALIEGLTYVVGIVMALTVLASGLALPPAEFVAYLAENLLVFHIWHLIIYIINGVFLVVLVQALYERLKGGAPALAQTGAAVGLIWAGLVIASGMLLIHDAGIVAEIYSTDPAQATTVWMALSAVEESLGGGIELPGGLWLLLVSFAALRTGALPKAVNYLGIVAGLGGVLMVLPRLADIMVGIFAIGAIVWFIWVGIVMLRGKSAAVVSGMEHAPAAS